MEGPNEVHVNISKIIKITTWYKYDRRKGPKLFFQISLLITSIIYNRHPD